MTQTILTFLILAATLGVMLSASHTRAQNPFQRQAMPSIGNLDPGRPAGPGTADRLTNQRGTPDEPRPEPRPKVSNPSAHNCVRLFGKRWSCATSPNRITTIDGNNTGTSKSAQ